MGRMPPENMDNQKTPDGDRGKDGTTIRKSGKKSDSQDRRLACKQNFTAGLKQLYDSVVDDPIPPHLMELLAQFDEKEGK